MGHWLADTVKSGQAVHFGSFVPAFTFSLCESEYFPACGRQAQMEHPV
jgi:hypothetical protein